MRPSPRTSPLNFVPSTPLFRQTILLSPSKCSRLRPPLLPHLFPCVAQANNTSSDTNSNMKSDNSRNVAETPQKSDAITSLQRRRIYLLVTDLATIVRTELPLLSHPTLDRPLSRLTMLATHLLPAPADDSSLRAALRAELWNLRRALLPASPSPHLRAALELTRSALLHTGAVAQARGAADEMTTLAAEVALLDEQRHLRTLERALHAAAAGLHPTARGALSAAAAALHVDAHRVRGKTALRRAAQLIREQAVVTERADVVQQADALLSALAASHKEDVARRKPAGRVMLVQPRVADIPNFSIVDATLLRGGQPNAAGLEWLADYGVTDVIDLRGSDVDNCWAGDSRAGAARRGVRFWNVPIEDFSTPDEAQVHGFVQLVDEIRAASGVVFVHCKAGIGRTGTMVACWRITHGEDVDKALGMERLYTEGGGGIRQERFVRNFAHHVVTSSSAAEWGTRPLSIIPGSPVAEEL